MSTSIRSSLATSSEVSIQRPSILTLQEGKNLLQQLSLGSEDYLRLQDLLIKTTGIFEVIIKNVSYKINTASTHCQLLGGFGGSEHFAIGTHIQLEGIDSKIILSVGDHSLEFSHIVALAGDFYGVPERAISFGKNDAEKTQRFEAAFDKLAKADAKTLGLIINTIITEHSRVMTSGTPFHCYGQCNLKGMSYFKEIKDDYEDLLIDNSDHFEKNAEDAYRIGHNVALEMARKAGQSRNKADLKRAYALDAFACHFLTDLFSAGHIRNQRGALETFLISNLKAYISHLHPLSPKKKIIKKFIASGVKLLAGVLTGAQHELDGKEGLHVENEDGEKWQAYGDGTYFCPNKRANQLRVIEATQNSVKEIKQAYDFYQAKPISCFKNFIPQPAPFIPQSEKSNNFPVYEIKDGNLILYKNGEEKKLRKGLGLIKDILDHAIDFLPQSYITECVLAKIKMYTSDRIKKILRMDKEPSPWKTKLVEPMFRKIMGSFLEKTGVMTYDLFQTEIVKIQEMIDEAAITSKHTDSNMESVLEKLTTIEKDLKSSKENYLVQFKEKKSKIEETLRNMKHQTAHFPAGNKDSADFQKSTLRSLYSDLVSLSEFLSRQAGNKGILLTSCQQQLRREDSQALEQEIILRVALWFQDALQIQREAFSYYCLISDSKEDESCEINAQVEKDSKKDELPWINVQIKVAENFFNDFDKEGKIAKSSSSYIALQLRKIEILNTPAFNPKK